MHDDPYIDPARFQDDSIEPGAREAPYLYAQKTAPAGWKLYPVWAVDGSGVCTCPKRAMCPSPGKHPMTRHGSRDATSDPQELAAMFAPCPEANVGGLCGVVSRVVVLDVDRRSGGFKSLELVQKEHGALPRTRTHLTGGGGLHYAFLSPEDGEPVPSIVAALPDGLELKADGNQVVLPPSNHASGGLYRVLIVAPLAPLPDWLLHLARSRSKKLVAVPGGQSARPEPGGFRLPGRISHGRRNDTLFRYACSLRSQGWSRDGILDELIRVDRERCDPSLATSSGGGGEEIRKIADSVARFVPGHSARATEEVLATVAVLEAMAAHRLRNGMSAHSRWAVYRALLDAAKHHGSIDQRDIAVRLGVRELARAAGLSRRTVHRALDGLDERGLVYRVSGGDGDVPGILALRVPDDLQIPEKGGRVDTIPPPSPLPPGTGDSSSPVLDHLYRLRWGSGRTGKVAASLLEAIIECPGASRRELARRLEKKPDSLKRQLKKLLDRRFIEKVGYGRYRVVADLEKAIDRERMLSGEIKAEQVDERLHKAEMEWYREERLRKRGGYQEGSDADGLP